MVSTALTSSCGSLARRLEVKGYALFNGMRVGERVRVSISKRRVYGGCALFRLERKGSPHRNRTLYSCEHTSHAELVDRFTAACETPIMTSFRVPRGRRVAHDLIVRNLNEDPSKREHHCFFDFFHQRDYSGAIATKHSHRIACQNLWRVRRATTSHSLRPSRTFLVAIFSMLIWLFHFG